jgi:hypothetical protein
MARLVIGNMRGGVGPYEFERWVHNPHMPIRRDLDRRATRVQQYQLRRVPRKTGLLASTSRKHPGRRGGRPSVQVLIGRQGITDYLHYILYGTPAHRIEAHRSALRFVLGGQVVFRRSVWHPGTRANNFVLESLPYAAR